METLAPTGICRTCACVPQPGNPYCRTCLNSLPGAENAQSWNADPERLTEIDGVVIERLASLGQAHGKDRGTLWREYRRKHGITDPHGATDARPGQIRIPLSTGAELVYPR